MQANIEDPGCRSDWPVRTRRLRGNGAARIRLAALLFIVGLLPILAGCASSGVVMGANPTAANAAVTYDFVQVTVTSTLANADREIQLLNALVITGLQQTGRFGHVTSSYAPDMTGMGLKVTAEIRELRGVSEAGRIWFGGLAGRARLLVHVTVTDIKSGAPVETFDAEGKSSGGTVFAGTTDQAIQRTAEQIVAEIIKPPS